MMRRFNLIISCELLLSSDDCHFIVFDLITKLICSAIKNILVNFQRQRIRLFLLQIVLS